jgi:hypothetical protein
MRLVRLLPLLLCALPGVAQAQSDIWKEHTVVEPPQEKRPARPRPGPFEEKPFALLAHFGLGTPYGLIGVAGTYSFIPHLALEGGVGTNGMGVQLASKLHLRFTPANHRNGFVAAGYSQGRHVQDDGRFESIFDSMGHNDTKYLTRTWSTARWLTIEGGYEHQSKEGFNLRFYGGFASLLNRGDAKSEEPPSNVSVNTTVKETVVSAVLPYLGLSVGQAF